MKSKKKVATKLPKSTANQRALAKAVNNMVKPVVAKAKVKAKLRDKPSKTVKKPVAKVAAKRPKIVVTVRLDAHIVDALRATGAGWQTRLNEFIEQGMSIEILNNVLASWSTKDSGMMG